MKGKNKKAQPAMIRDPIRFGELFRLFLQGRSSRNYATGFLIGLTDTGTGFSTGFISLVFFMRIP